MKLRRGGRCLAGAVAVVEEALVHVPALRLPVEGVPRSALAQERSRPSHQHIHIRMVRGNALFYVNISEQFPDKGEA